MAKPRWVPQTRRGLPNATTRAPRGCPRKTRRSTLQVPSPQVATEGRIKQEAIRRGRPATRQWSSAQEESSEESESEDESAEDSDEADALANRWTTVELRHSRQAQTLARTLSEDVDNLIPPLVRNLHVHSSLRDVNDWSPPLTGLDLLGTHDTDVASALTRAGKLQCLAIDMSLVAVGFLEDSAARPSRVMLLEDTTAPGRSCASSECPRVFKKATHVVVEPDWSSLRHVLPHPRSLFPALQSLCIQVDAISPSVDATVALVQELLRIRRLEKLVVCMRSGCSRDAPVWKALRGLSTTEARLRVLPDRFAFETEWRAMITGESTVFNVSLVELQKRAAAIDSVDDDWCKNFERSVSAWRYKPPSMQVSLSDAAVDRENSPFLDNQLGALLTDVQAVDVDYLAPDLPTAEDDFRDMMSNHVDRWLL